MAYAAYRESFVPCLSAVRSTAMRWMVMDVTVRSCDAVRVRRALAACPGAGVLRCIPLLCEHRARLEVRLPEALAAQVMHCVMSSVPDGEIGAFTSWPCHLQRRGL